MAMFLSTPFAWWCGRVGVRRIFSVVLNVFEVVHVAYMGFIAQTCAVPAQGGAVRQWTIVSG